MRRRYIEIAAAGVLLLAAGVGYYYYGLNQSEPPVAAQPSAHSDKRELRFPPGAPQLSFVKVEQVAALPEPLLDPLNARVAYDENRTVRVSSPIAGRVMRIMAQPGDRVAADQALLVVDAPDFAAAVADVGKSAADLNLKQKAYARADELFQGEVIARKEVESAESDLRQTEVENRRAIQRLRNLVPNHSAADSAYSIRTPMGGIVTERNVNPGTEVRPDLANPLFVITDPTHLWVIADLPEIDLSAVHVGQNVSIEVDAYPNERFPGRVATIGEVLDPATRRVQVRCVVDNPKRLLKPEMYAKVTPLADTQVKLPRIPNSALITEGLYSFLFVEKEPGVFEKRQVTLGLQGRSVSYVKGGLNDGDRVVSSGALLLNSELAGVD